MPEERQVTIQAETVEEYNERVRTVAATMPFQGEPTIIGADVPAPVEESVVEEPVAEESPEPVIEPVEPEAVKNSEEEQSGEESDEPAEEESAE